MIDTHCHILPGLDDGARDPDEAIKMARIAADDGIRQIIATPHVFDNGHSPADIAARVETLNRAIGQHNIPVTVHAGAEASIGLDPESLRGYTIHDTHYILIEFPHDHMPAHAGKMLLWIAGRGLRPIIAHPERNSSILRSPERFLRLLTGEVYVQITAGSITGDFGRDVQYCADILLSSGRVDLIASDAHSWDSRPPLLSPAFRATAGRYGEAAAHRLMHVNPASVLAGEEIH